MKSDKNSIVKLGFKEAKKRYLILSLPLSFFALLTIGMLILGFFFPLTLFLTIPFVVIPSFFAVSAINTVANNNNAHEGLGFFVMFRAYFSQIFKGGYKVIIGLLKYLLTYIVSAIILSLILSATVLSKDPAYIELIHQFETVTDTAQLTQLLNDFINNNVTLNNLMIIISIISVFLGSYFFLHHFAVNSLKYNYNFLSKFPIPVLDLNIVQKIFIKNNFKTFYKNYYKAFWFLGIVFASGYAGGSVLSYFFIPNIDMMQITVVGLFGGFIFLLFFIPYFLNASQLIFIEYRGSYFSILMDLSKESLQKMREAKTITEEKEKEVLKIIESQKDDDLNDDKDNNSN